METQGILKKSHLVDDKISKLVTRRDIRAFLPMLCSQC